MANYFVGDLQGCYYELRRLLDKVAFDPSQDTLWCVGDLVARGPDSLATLEYLYQLGNSVKTVLGNHDLHLMALAAGIKKRNPKDKLDLLLDSPQLPEYIDWLRQQPLMRYLPKHQLIMTHAGVPPQWNIDTLIAQTNKVSQALQQEDYISELIAKMYHDKQAYWHDELSEFEKLRYTIDALTRMRFLHDDGSLNFNCKQPPELCDDPSLQPWFKWDSEIKDTNRLIFGHWAALMGETNDPNVIALDTGCVWGGQMTLWHLETCEKITQKRLKKV
ncbi:symmetrical bis(5'-nucleosyl)-tetraphosphatase [Parashewanella curva]|uniref:Bis(5'-nucleosyl)-tetraphosphatase, symmetrical n=1 Tax=Parashewanella curva TaxID=2338552 RepID=A0A3L8PSR5_9GAMM|nr:symmetrical bis(5'-nucleosyl)-tetraphosphatase [Parashewanella curva]RLV58435.1 symmetrical bis(5'-nucleosyl)-tetraphosphatase [Parashewanella curva]